MEAMTVSVQADLPSLPTPDVERVSRPALASLHEALQEEIAGTIDDLVTRVVAEAEAAVERACAPEQIARQAAENALEEQTRRNDGLAEELQQSKTQFEEISLKLNGECEDAKAARDACAAEQDARARAEAANEAQAAALDQIVSEYEARVHGLQAELEAARAESFAAKQQLEEEAAERTRLIAALKTVHQACALVEPQTDMDVARVPSRTTRDVDADGNVPGASVQMRDDETLAPATSAAGRTLKLVGGSHVAPVEAPLHLLEYSGELFEQVETMYYVDRQSYSWAEVVDRLAANLRYARDMFVQQGLAEGLEAESASLLFEQRLSAKVDELGSTTLGRHLAIAAYELTQPSETPVHAEAS